jgi:hypothetical protein
MWCDSRKKPFFMAVWGLSGPETFSGKAFLAPMA